jgi:hypothetical protein
MLMPSRLRGLSAFRTSHIARRARFSLTRRGGCCRLSSRIAEP